MCLKAQQTIYKKTDIFCGAYLIKVIFIVCLEKSFAGFMQIVCSHLNLSANNPRYEQYKFDSQKKRQTHTKIDSHCTFQSILPLNVCNSNMSHGCECF